MKAAPLDNTDQPARNRRSATRLVVAVLLFHSLALGAGAWVLHQASQAAGARSPASVLQRAGHAAATAAPLAADPTSLRAELPRWVLQAQGRDTAAPWRVDAQGRVVLPTGER